MQPCAGRMAQALAGRQVSSQRAETGEFFPMSVWSSLSLQICHGIYLYDAGNNNNNKIETMKITI